MAKSRVEREAALGRVLEDEAAFIAWLRQPVPENAPAVAEDFGAHYVAHALAEDGVRVRVAVKRPATYVVEHVNPDGASTTVWGPASEWMRRASAAAMAAPSAADASRALADCVAAVVKLYPQQ